VALQELDGTFRHTLQIESSVAKNDLTCHSKSRRNKKKKIPLRAGEEVDMDLSNGVSVALAIYCQIVLK
jgi:transcription initiation factor TFIID subunit 2